MRPHDWRASVRRGRAGDRATLAAMAETRRGRRSRRVAAADQAYSKTFALMRSPRTPEARRGGPEARRECWLACLPARRPLRRRRAPARRLPSAPSASVANPRPARSAGRRGLSAAGGPLRRRRRRVSRWRMTCPRRTLPSFEIPEGPGQLDGPCQLARAAGSGRMRARDGGGQAEARPASSTVSEVDELRSWDHPRPGGVQNISGCICCDLERECLPKQHCSWIANFLSRCCLQNL